MSSGARFGPSGARFWSFLGHFWPSEGLRVGLRYARRLRAGRPDEREVRAALTLVLETERRGEETTVYVRDDWAVWSFAPKDCGWDCGCWMALGATPTQIVESRGDLAQVIDRCCRAGMGMPVDWWRSDQIAHKDEIAVVPGPLWAIVIVVFVARAIEGARARLRKIAGKSPAGSSGTRPVGPSLETR